MTSLSLLHGADHEKQSRQMKASFELNSIITNISQSNLKFSITTDVIWDKGNMYQSAKKELIERMNKRNNKMICQWINKLNPKELKALPKLVINSPVEYLLLLDTSTHKPTMYTLCITPKHCFAF